MHHGLDLREEQVMRTTRQALQAKQCVVVARGRRRLLLVVAAYISSR